MATDPVRGMEVRPETAAASAEFEGATYYFCAQSCQDAFLAEPHRYLNGEAGKKGGSGLLSRLLRRH